MLPDWSLQNQQTLNHHSLGVMVPTEQNTVSKKTTALETGTAFLTDGATLVPSLIFDLEHEAVSYTLPTTSTHIHFVLCLLCRRIVTCEENCKFHTIKVSALSIGWHSQNQLQKCKECRIDENKILICISSSLKHIT